MMLHVQSKWCMVVPAGVLLGILGAGIGIAAQIDGISVTHHDDAFKIEFDAVVDAPAQQVYAVLADYASLGKLNPAITAISVEVAPTGRGERVRSVIKTCVWFFCRQIVQVEDVMESDPNTISARIVPGAGDFESGSFFWRLTDEGPRTRLHYEATRVAGFWIPPLIGPWAIKRTLREQLESSIVLLERLASSPGNPQAAPAVALAQQTRVAGEYLVTLAARAEVKAIADLYGRFGIKTIKELGRNVFLVTLTEDPGPDAMEKLRGGNALIKAVEPNFVYRTQGSGSAR
jgi:hypothetical protein